MNVRLAAQTLSSSVADAIELFEETGHPNFQGAAATIKFIRVVDRLFDLLNARSSHGKGFKSPMRPMDRPLWNKVIEESIEYLSTLKDENGVLLTMTRRKTFVSGMIINAKST